MYNYIIINSKRIDEEIDKLLSFPFLKKKIKEKLLERIIIDAKENCDFLTPEKLFEEREFGVWFHTISYPEFRTGIARYDTFIVYRCSLEDNRQDIQIILE